MIKWIELDKVEALEKIRQDSFSKKAVLFKHSTRCSISRAVLKYFEMDGEKIAGEKYDFYFLDLLNHRDISAGIAEMFNVKHESPQMLVIKNGECILHKSHSDISVNDLIVIQEN